LIANLALASFQKRMGSELGVKPGEEMIAAVDAAKEHQVPFALCDREIQTTLRRAWGACGLWSKCKLLAALLSSAFGSEEMSAEDIESLKQQSELDGMMAELAGYLPKVKEVLIDERDRYLAAKIYAETLSHNAAKSIAVLGAGHIKGVQAWLEHNAAESRPGDKPVDNNLAELDTLPPKSMLGKAASWIIPVVLVALIAVGFFRAGAGASLEMIVRWVLWNGSLAALGSLIALGHPLAILVSFVAAPIGTLNPVLSVGFFSGIVQAWVRKPQVKDAENLSADVLSVKGIYRNRITHALLVFLLSGLGGAVGNIISVPALASVLAGG
jgi:pheromone shutdown-related protein TraB